MMSKRIWLLWCGLSLALYGVWGDYQGVYQRWHQEQTHHYYQKTLQDFELGALSLEQFITQVQQRQDEYGPDLEGLLILTEVYLAQNEASRALEQVGRASALAPEMAEVAEKHLQVKLRQPGYQVTEQDASKALELFKQGRRSQAVVHALALSAFEQQDYKSAARFWETLLPRFEPDSQDYKLLSLLIKNCQARLV